MINGLLVSEATGSAALSMTVTPTTDFVIDCFRIHLSAVGASGNLTITIDDGTNAVYDTVLTTQDMSSIADYVYLPTRPIPCKSGDKVVIAWANAGTKTYGAKLICRQV